MKRALLIGAVLTVLIGVATGLGVGYAIWRMAPNLPSLPTDPHELGIRPGTEMYAASGERIYTFNQSRQWVPLEHISPPRGTSAHCHGRRALLPPPRYRPDGHCRRAPRQPAQG